MNPEQFGGVLICGLRISAIYALMAVGFTLVYGVGKIFNYAHGGFYTWGAYIAWFLSAGFCHLSYPIAFATTIPILFGLGTLFERFFIRPVRWGGAGMMNIFIVTLGAALFLDALALVIFGPIYKRLPPLLGGNLSLAGFVISRHDLTLVAIVIAITIGLILFLGKTREGTAMRAVSQDMIGAQIVGMPIDRVFALTFGISTVLAGVSGMLLAPRTLIFPGVGWPIFMKAFVIVVLGGMGSIKGSLIAAFILGMLEAFIAYFIGGVWGLPIFCLVLLILLVVRPQGLFGTAG